MIWKNPRCEQWSPSVLLASTAALSCLAQQNRYVSTQLAMVSANTQAPSCLYCDLELPIDPGEPIDCTREVLMQATSQYHLRCDTLPRCSPLPCGGPPGCTPRRCKPSLPSLYTIRGHPSMDLTEEHIGMLPKLGLLSKLPSDPNAAIWPLVRELSVMVAR